VAGNAILYLSFGIVSELLQEIKVDTLFSPRSTGKEMIYMNKRTALKAAIGRKVVFTTHIRLKNGKILWAKDCGRKAFRFTVER